MSQLIWIASAGGPLVLITENIVKKWSGSLNRKEYLENNKREATNNFMDPDETDYGKACLVNDYLAVLTIENVQLLILGDEPLVTTCFLSVDNKYVLARCYYTEDEASLDDYLQKLNFNEIDNWNNSVSFEISCDTQYLFDSAEYYDDLSQQNIVNIKKGKYEIWTSLYEFDNETKLILHKFKKII